MRAGSEPAKVTRPRTRAESDRDRTSQPCATVCIQLPMFERKSPIQYLRKARCRSEENIPRRSPAPPRGGERPRFEPAGLSNAGWLSPEARADGSVTRLQAGLVASAAPPG